MTYTPYPPGPGHSQYMVCQCESGSTTTKLPLLPRTTVIDGTITYDEFCGYTAFPSSTISAKSAFDSTASPSSVPERSPARARSSGEMSDSSPMSSAVMKQAPSSTSCTANTFTGYVSGMASPYVVCSCNGFEAPLSTQTIGQKTHTVCAYQPDITVSIPTEMTTAHAMTTFPPSTTSESGSEIGKEGTGATGAGIALTISLGMVLGAGIAVILFVL